MAATQQSISRSINQQTIISQLVDNFGVDPQRILFLDPNKPDEPWLPSEVLTQIARDADLFKAIDEEYANYIEPLGQIVHRATVVDKQDRIYTRSGVASLVEEAKLDDRIIDAHALAASRALNAALNSAGFNPLRTGAVVSLDKHRQPVTSNESEQPINQAQALRSIQAKRPDEAATRNTQLKQIHMLAERAGLILVEPDGRRDMKLYRDWLFEQFEVDTAATLDESQRASAINALQMMLNPATAIN